VSILEQQGQQDITDLLDIEVAGCLGGRLVQQYGELPQVQVSAI